MYNTSITVVAALAAALIPIASAIQLTNLNIPTLTSGQSYDLEWSGDGSPVSIILKESTTNELFTVQTLAPAAKGDSASITIPTGLKTGEYALTLSQSGKSVNSPPFTVLLSPSQVSNNGDHGKAATSPGIKLTNSGYPTLSSGQKFHLTWTGDGSLVEIVLKEGTSGSLFTVQTLASAATGESADVTIPAGLKTGEYAFEIKQSGKVNYSPQFTVLLPASQVSEFGVGATAIAKASAQAAKSPPTASVTSSESPTASGSLPKAGSQQSIVPFTGGANPVAGAVSRSALWATGAVLFVFAGGFVLA